MGVLCSTCQSEAEAFPIDAADTYIIKGYAKSKEVNEQEIEFIEAIRSIRIADINVKVY